MTTKITYEFIKQLADELHREVNIGYIIDYLTRVGLCYMDKDTSDLMAADSAVERIKSLLSPIAMGDIVLVFNKGTYVVIDTNPTAYPDGKHFRGIRVLLNAYGDWQIDVATRSEVFPTCEAICFATSKFDIKAVNEYCYDRYAAFNKIAELNDKLHALRG